MAVDVNKVYQRVLAIANKEQRGYITPQEFNILANQAQLDIFDQYFYDLGQFLRVHGNNTTFADAVEMLKEKISTFEKYNTTISSGVTLPTDLYRLNCVRFNGVEAELISLKDFYRIQNSYLLSPRDEYPIYIRTEGAIKVYGHTSSTNHTLSQKTSNFSVGIETTLVLLKPIFKFKYFLQAETVAVKPAPFKKSESLCRVLLFKIASSNKFKKSLNFVLKASLPIFFKDKLSLFFSIRIKSGSFIK